MFHQANHCADVQTTIHRLDEPGAQNRGIRLINKAAKAAGGCLLTGWVLIRQNMIRRCAIIVSACIGNFYKEVLCKNTVSMKILLCLCAASASHFRPSGQAAASASLRVEVDVEDQPQRIEIQVLGLNPSHAQQTRDEVWPDMIRYDQIWPDMTSMSSYEHMQGCGGCGCMSNQLSKEKNRTCKCAAILQPHVATQYRDGCMLCSPVRHSPPCLRPRCCPLWSRPQHIGWSSWVVTTCRVGPKSDLTQLRLKQIGGEVLPQPVGSWYVLISCTCRCPSESSQSTQRNEDSH